jgi:hypothetical protein
MSVSMSKLNELVASERVDICAGYRLGGGVSWHVERQVGRTQLKCGWRNRLHGRRWLAGLEVAVD